AKHLVQWIKDGMPPVDQSWCDRIWSEVNVIPVELS
ncbi:MAG: glycosyltransferase, partial [Nitrosomonadaceae bacterium]|nr:glycosyltransferase [Nitrosomonadaceae bacterium]